MGPSNLGFRVEGRRGDERLKFEIEVLGLKGDMEMSSSKLGFRAQGRWEMSASNTEMRDKR